MDIKLSNQDHQDIYDSVVMPKNSRAAYKESDLEVIYEGDNLPTLKYLIEKHGLRKKIDLVYIDPPFSTNNSFRISDSGRVSTISATKTGEIAYDDNLSGEDYLNFIRQRLVLLKEIMSDNASIYFHIDYKIGHYIKIIMDEVFGVENFRNDIARIKCNPKNFRRKAFGNVKDLILFYAWGDYTWNDPRNKFTETDITKLFPKVDKNGRRYTTNPLHAPGETANGLSGMKWKGMLPPEGRHWRYSPTKLDELEEKGLIEWSKNKNPRVKIYADERADKGKKAQDIWEFKDPQYPEYPTQKNEELLKFIIKTSTNPGDLVLDCFAGSGTTLAAAKKTGRKWIGIDQSSVALKVSKSRLENTSRPLTLF